MFSDHINQCNYPTGEDDGHLDFSRYLIRKGKNNVELFIKNPCDTTMIIVVK